MATVSGLTVFPLKSGSGTALEAAELTARGLAFDREFMLVDPSSGRHLSQREFPRLALLAVHYDGRELTVDDFVHRPVDNGPLREVTVHGTPCKGIDQGDEAAAHFGAFLGSPCRLVRFAGHRADAADDGELMFADGFPVLVLSRESLDDLNARLDEPLPMDRFRPNLVLSGLGAFGEDTVRRIRVGTAELEIVKPCPRCLITTVDQATGVRGKEPLRTLAKYRATTWDGRRGVMFGQNAVPRSTGVLRVGDPVEVLEYAA